MSSYFDGYLHLQQAQYETALILALIGLAWGLGWMLIGRIVPFRFRALARWYTLLMAGIVIGIVLVSMRG